jgi:type 2 lantibiotic biosynthesis protein LanM
MPVNTRLALRLRSLVRTLPLEARIDLLDRSKRKSVPGRQAAQAGKTIRRWKRRLPFKEGGFASWLARYRIDEEELAALVRPRLTSSIREHVKRQILWREFETLRTPVSVPPLYVPPLAGHEALLHLVQPLVALHLEEIKREFEALRSRGAAIFDLELALHQATQDICRLALYLIQKTCVLELHVAGVRGELAGDDSLARYRSFVARLSTTAGREALFREYPLLLEAVVTRLNMYQRNIVQFLGNLIADAEAIARDLRGGAQIGKLSSWTVGTGDSHRGGRAVMTLAFDDGSRLVYKPRSLRIDEGFSRLLDWCNAQLPECPLRAARVLDRGTHGWCEFIEHRELTSEAEAVDFFRRQGKFMALFYALHAGDLHFENMIACGSHPVYIDLETLFHAQLFSPSQDDGEWRDAWPMTVAETMIIPRSQAVPAVSSSTPDFSIFGAKPGQDMNARSLRLACAGTDGAHFKTAEVVLNEKRHLPMRNGHVVVASLHVGTVARGFREMYELISAHTPFLVSKHGLRQMFAGAELRVVFRPTEVYASIIDTSLHPDYLSDSLERRVFLEQLYLNDADACWRNDLLACEVEEMQRLDVPYFSIPFEGGAVLNGRSAPVQGVHWPSPAQVVADHLMGFGKCDLDAQLGLIEAVLMPTTTEASHDTIDAAGCSARWRGAHHPGESANVCAQRVAAEIADRILAARVSRREERYWFCKTLVDDRLMTGPGVVNLYDGQLGIAVFLGWAARTLGRAEYGELAADSLRTVQKWTQNGTRYLPNLGVFTGALGFPYALASVGIALGRSDLCEEAFHWLGAFDPERCKEGLDVLDGAAGAVLFLSSMLDRFGASASDFTRSASHLVSHFASRLMERSVRQNSGVGWAPEPPHKRPLTGFAHGAAGCSAALYAAAKWSDEPACLETAREAVIYENAQFSTALGTWADLRVRGPADDPRAQKLMSAWCNGSPGILLGRLLSLEAQGKCGPDRARLLHDAANVARVVLAEHSGTSNGNLSLCHGGLGNVEILARAAAHPELAAVISADECRDWVLRDDIVWRCGDDFRSPLASAAAAPGIMNGLAGIGYGLLRLSAPEIVPSVLALEVMPRQCAMT